MNYDNREVVAIVYAAGNKCLLRHETIEREK